GGEVTCVDVAKEKLQESAVVSADLIGFQLPMHTAARLGAPLSAAARRVNPAARICAFGLYAPLNDEWLRSLGADAVFGGEFEEDLMAWAGSSFDPSTSSGSSRPPSRDDRLRTSETESKASLMVSLSNHEHS